MTIIFTMVLLHSFFCLWSFGLAILLTSNTPFFKYAPAISAISWPTLLIFILSGGGHVRAATLFTNAGFLIWLGPLLTIVVLLRFAARLREMDWATCGLVHGLAILAGLLPILPLIAHNGFGYFEFLNGEFLNYAQLAAHALGIQHDTVPIPWEQAHAQIRDGVDFINATIVLLTGHYPIHIVQLTSGLLRMSYCAGVFLLLFAALANRPRGAITASAIAIGFCFYNLDIFHFQASFMAANTAMTEAVLLFSLLVARHGLRLTQLLAAYVICSTVLLVTYPEATALIKIIEVVMVADQLIRCRDRLFASWWIFANLVVVAINPMMVISKIDFVLSLSQTDAGWNFMGDPVAGFASYFIRLAGLDFIYLPNSQILPRSWSFPIVLLGLAGLSAALVALGRRLDTFAVAVVPIVLSAFHIVGYMRMPPNFYGEMKVVLWFTWIIPLAVAAMALGRNGYLRRAALASIGLVAAINIVVFWRAASVQMALPTFHSETEARAVVSSMSSSGGRVRNGIIDAPDGIASWYWGQIFDYESVRLVWLSESQYSWFAREWLAAFLPNTENHFGATALPEQADELFVARPLASTGYGPDLRLIVIARPAALELPGLPADLAIGKQEELYSSPLVSLYRISLLRNNSAKSTDPAQNK